MIKKKKLLQGQNAQEMHLNSTTTVSINWSCQSSPKCCCYGYRRSNTPCALIQNVSSTVGWKWGVKKQFFWLAGCCPLKTYLPQCHYNAACLSLTFSAGTARSNLCSFHMPECSDLTSPGSLMAALEWVSVLNQDVSHAKSAFQDLLSCDRSPQLKILPRIQVSQYQQSVCGAFVSYWLDNTMVDTAASQESAFYKWLTFCNK